jgi:hypothetical protein
MPYFPRLGKFRNYAGVVKRSIIFVLLGTALVTPFSRAQTIVNSLQPLTFLTGHWTSNADGEFQEEYWSPVQGGSMVGTFRVVRLGKPVFYEFWVIEVEDGKPVYKLKHFNGGLKGWEEKDDLVRLPVRELDSTHVVFANGDGTLSLRYERKGTELTATLRHIKDGKPSDEVFLLHRAD